MRDRAKLRQLMRLSGLGLPCLLAGSLAHAQEALPGDAASWDAIGMEDQFLAGSMAPRLIAAATTASTYGGYDSARRTPLAGAEVEVALTSWLGLRAGVVYNPLDRSNDAARPNFGLRAQILRQEAHAVNASVAIAYRQERFTEDGGLYQALVSVGRRWGRVNTFVNASYSRDPEGDDFEGELRAASLYKLTSALDIGVQGNYRRDLGSTDYRKAERADPLYDLVVGPMMTYAVSGWQLLIQTGLAAVKDASLHLGVMGLGGVGTTF